MGDSLNEHGGFVDADIAQRNGGVAVMEQVSNGLMLTQPGNGPVLPVDGGAVGPDIFQVVVADEAHPADQVQTLV